MAKRKRKPLDESPEVHESFPKDDDGGDGDAENIDQDEADADEQDDVAGLAGFAPLPEAEPTKEIESMEDSGRSVCLTRIASKQRKFAKGL